jgi:hypothetical protein
MGPSVDERLHIQPSVRGAWGAHSTSFAGSDDAGRLSF